MLEPSLGIYGVPNCHISVAVHVDDNTDELLELYLAGLLR